MTRRRLRSPSLFWTFAAAFLVVLVGGVILQGLLIFTVFRPLAHRLETERAKGLARDAAVAIAALGAGAGDGAIRDVLASHRGERGEREALLVYVDPSGRAISERPMPPGFERRLQAIAAGDTARGPQRGRLLDPAAGRRPPPGAGLPEGGPPEVLARATVPLADGPSGQVVAFGRRGRFPFIPPATPRPLLLFLPVAFLLAGVAALVMFRILLRRITALEGLATRVTDGDLSARIDDPGTDEIGRLGSRLNFMTERLADARDRLEESDRQRRRLLTDITHELATPLTSIRGYTETLLNPDVPVSPDERAEYLKNVLDEARRMDLLVQDLLDLGRLESGTVPLVEERLDWAALCANIVARYETRFSQSGLSLVWSGPAAQAAVMADGRRLEQLLENLLINAMRYVPAGGSVTVAMAAAAERHRLTIADDGPGVPAVELRHIFDRFYRVDEARAPGGSGLGLAIVREIVLRHRGVIRAEAAEPHGLRIVVELPAAAG